MDEKYLRWSISTIGVFAAIALVSALVAVFAKIESIMSVLFIISILSLFLALLSILISLIISTYEIATSAKLTIKEKSIYIVLIWLFQILGVGAYYYRFRKNAV